MCVGWTTSEKLRGSYGSSGNDAIPTGIYNYIFQVGPFGYYDLSGTNTSSMVEALFHVSIG